MKRFFVAAIACLLAIPAANADPIGDFVADLSAMAAAMPHTTLQTDEYAAVQGNYGYADGKKFGVSGEGSAWGVGGALRLSPNWSANLGYATTADDPMDVWSVRAGVRYGFRGASPLK